MTNFIFVPLVMLFRAYSLYAVGAYIYLYVIYYRRMRKEVKHNKNVDLLPYIVDFAKALNRFGLFLLPYSILELLGIVAWFISIS